MLGIRTYTLVFPCVSQCPLFKGFKRIRQGPRALMLTLFGLAFFFSRNSIDSSFQWVSLECFLPSSILLHVLYPNQDPLVPSSGTKPEDITCPFHFFLPFEFDKTSNESFFLFLLSRIHVSDLFPNYLLGCLCPSQDLQIGRAHV